jgi:hypothetical protein
MLTRGLTRSAKGVKRSVANVPLNSLLYRVLENEQVREMLGMHPELLENADLRKAASALKAMHGEM